MNIEVEGNYFELSETPKSEVLDRFYSPIYPSVAKHLELEFDTSSGYVFQEKNYSMTEAIAAYFDFYEKHRFEVVYFLEQKSESFQLPKRASNVNSDRNPIVTLSNPTKLNHNNPITTQTIFAQLVNTRLFKKLSKENPLLFIGDEETLRFIEKSILAISNPQPHRYETWKGEFQEKSEIFDNFNQYSALVVASLEREKLIYEEIFRNSSNKIPVLRLLDDVFVNVVADRPLTKPIDDNFQPPSLSYAILTTPRSGSTYLCDLLKTTKIAGAPAEHIRLINSLLTKNCQFDNLRFLNVLMQNRISKNSVFGTKFISHFLFSLQQTEPQFKEILTNRISKYIYLMRKDKASQAISTILAQKTNIWHIFNEEIKAQYDKKIKALEINDELLDEVYQIYCSFVNQEKQLEKMIEDYQLNALFIQYEDLVENTQDRLKDVLTHLGLSIQDEELVRQEVKSKKLKSGVTQTILERFNQKYSSLLKS